MIRIIDNKKIDLTDSEYNLYLQICESYTTPRFNGESLFKDLFETDNDGFIIFIRPSDKPVASLEVYLFVISIMVHQHLRNSNREYDLAIKDLRRAKEEYESLSATIKEAASYILAANNKADKL